MFQPPKFTYHTRHLFETNADEIFTYRILNMLDSHATESELGNNKNEGQIRRKSRHSARSSAELFSGRPPAASEDDGVEYT